MKKYLTKLLIIVWGGGIDNRKCITATKRRTKRG